MMYGNKEKIRGRAHLRADYLNPRLQDDPWKTLWTIDFKVPFQNYVDQKETVTSNLEVDRKSCLGRVAQAAALIEKHFPDVNLQLAEVRKDRMAEMMLEMLAEDPDKKHNSSFMSELLMYEEPHMALLVDGIQFEPLSLQLGQNIQHPKVEVFPLWEGITASVLTSQAWLEKDPLIKMNILSEAESLCPGTTLVGENMCEPLELLGGKEELLARINWCVKERPCARNLYVMYALTGDKSYYDHLVEVYSEEIIKYF